MNTSRYAELFETESRGHLAALNYWPLELERQPEAREPVSAMFRAVHTVKWFFDFLPLDLGRISGFTARLQLYTVPGQPYYQSTRRLVLQGADGVVFMCDSRREQLEENIESMRDLHAILADDAGDIRSLPLVLRYNKQGLAPDSTLPVPDLEDALNFRSVPSFSAGALHGTSAFETLRAISELVLRRPGASSRAAS